MKRVRGILFNTLTAASLVGCIAVAALWTLSVGAPRELRAGDQILALGLANVSSGVFVSVTQRDPLSISAATADDPTPFGWSLSATRPLDWRIDRYWAGDPAREYHSLFGIGYFSLDKMKTDYIAVRVIRVPHAWLMVFLGFPPTMRLGSRFSAHRRNTAGHCPACGYDTRANPARCSECGRVAEGMRAER